MAGKTRLYQQAKSPLIQGHSKHARPGWQSWLGATLLGWLVATVVLGAVRWYQLFSQRQQVVPIPEYVRAGYTTALATLIFAALGSALAVWLAEQMGWRRRAFGSAMAGAVCGVLLGEAFIIFVLDRWSLFL